MSILVIMESPSKAGTVQGYLGPGYKVVASLGHVRDLAKSNLSVDVDNNFEPHYINIRGKTDIIKDLKKRYKSATKTYLATDADREGEAISWHLAQVLGIKEEDTKRITFNEVTKSAVEDAIKNPRQIDMNLVNSQQARRILDRIVGYKLSPFLWSKVRSGLSAGRVQSVATRIIVDRENEINDFIPEEYWNITVTHTAENDSEFKSKFYGTEKGKIELKNKEDADKILSSIRNRDFVVLSVKKSIKRKSPQPPFTTSTMQQEASKKLGFRTDRTMRVAQELYEGLDIGSENGGTQGLITYMRTDSLRISTEAQQAAQSFIKNKYGDKYFPSTPNIFKSKKNAQDAHEAIRPSNINLVPEQIKKYLSADQYKLYKLIWDRFLSSQMSAAEYNISKVDIGCGNYIFKSTGSTILFDGYLKLSDDRNDNTATADDEASALPALSEGEILQVKSINPEQHFTEPPARFNEASFVKYLEDEGIGRPSTYATIVSTIISRGYIKREGKTLVPTDLGKITTDLMIKNFPDIVDCKFTANMENDLDLISDGEVNMTEVLGKFYDKFISDLEKAEKDTSIPSLVNTVEETDMTCEKCGAKMIVKSGRFGKFAACPNYPNCKFTKPLIEKEIAAPTIVAEKGAEKKICEKCGAEMVLKVGKYGQFYACSNYPTCKNTMKIQNEIGVPCPLCGEPIVSKISRSKNVFYSCSTYPKCDFSSWDKPIAKKCPLCSSQLYIKKGKHLVVCKKEGCGYSEPISEEENNEKQSDKKD